jgi:TolB-like protein/Tfp pilus assembly protein PilF
MPDHHAPTGAVFLSYASEDSAAAERVCAALRRAGIEVWFDRDALRGGDAWDSKIKHQIQECALFVPIVSAHTDARTEGYFRREWKLATRRLLDIADDAAFLVPVIIDDTTESRARVPDEFLGVQWTRLPGGETPTTFAERVLHLLRPDPVLARSALSSIKSVQQDARNRAVRPLKPQRLGLALAILLLLSVSGAYWWHRNGTNDALDAAKRAARTAAESISTASEQSIAVLPFVDLSAEKDQEYMADGIAEELLNLLAKVPDLKVIARTSSFAFKGKNLEVPEIARKLAVAHVLEGSVRSSGDRLRITTQLVRAADGTHLWSQTYDRPLGDIFELQDEIASAVVSELKIKLLTESPKSKVRKPEAHTLFLQARAIADQYTPATLDNAISLYRRALEVDPSYAEAWDGLAFIYANQALDGLRPREEGFRLSNEAAQEALILDSRSALAHARLGWISIYYDQDLERAARHFEDALAADSGNAEVLKMTVALLWHIGRLDQAIQYAEHVVARDPVNSDAYLSLARANYFAGRFETAIPQYRTAIALSPSGLGGHAMLGEALVMQGDARAALEEIKLESDAAWVLEVRSVAHHALGKAAASEAEWKELAERYGGLFVTAVAEVAAFRGDADSAFEWLEKAAASRDPNFGQVPISPFCRKLHEDPRWLPFLRKHGMAPEQLAAIKFDFDLPTQLP